MKNQNISFKLRLKRSSSRNPWRLEGRQGACEACYGMCVCVCLSKVLLDEIDEAVRRWVMGADLRRVLQLRLDLLGQLFPKFHSTHRDGAEHEDQTQVKCIWLVIFSFSDFYGSATHFSLFLLITVCYILYNTVTKLNPVRGNTSVFSIVPDERLYMCPYVPWLINCNL